MKTDLLYKEKERKSAFIWLIIILLIATNFLGLEPFASLVNANTKPIILLKCLILLPFAIKISKQKNNYTKWLLFLWISFALNKISSCYFRGQSLAEVPFQGAFIYDFALFYLVAYINPSVRQVEKAITYLGIASMIIYFLQYLLLPKPIVESLTSGWRAVNDAVEFDIQRFAVTGELIIFLYGLFSLNKYLLYKFKIDAIIVLLSFIITLLHGYRSLMLAYMFSCILLYFKVNSFKFNKNTLGIIFIVISIIYLINFTPIFDNVLSQISEKNTNQSELNLLELDRVIEWNYFYDNITKPWEWIFGAGFLGKNFTDTNLFFNWGDLGFIGLSFMGGIILTICWIRLLCLKINDNTKKFIYLQIFFVLIILSTLVLPTAFTNKNIGIEILAIYLGYKINICRFRICFIK